MKNIELLYGTNNGVVCEVEDGKKITKILCASKEHAGYTEVYLPYKKNIYNDSHVFAWDVTLDLSGKAVMGNDSFSYNLEKGNVIGC